MTEIVRVPARELRVGDRWRHNAAFPWSPVTLLAPTDRGRAFDGKGDGLYVCGGSGVPTRIWNGQVIEILRSES